MDKINFQNGVTKVNADTFNTFQDNIEKAINEAMLAVKKAENPIGHIRMEISDTNPSTYLGFGTWVLWGTGRVPVGVDTSQTEFNKVEKTVGTKTHTHTNPSTDSYSGTTESHTLTTSEIPSHEHTLIMASGSSSSSSSGYYGIVGGWYSSKVENGDQINNTGKGNGHTHKIPSHSHTISDTGSSSNIQPSITCYMWKRTA